MKAKNKKSFLDFLYKVAGREEGQAYFSRETLFQIPTNERICTRIIDVKKV